MKNQVWFKPKTHGYGSYPASWKGWALIVVFGLVQLAMAIMLLVPHGSQAETVDLTRVAAFMLGTAVLTGLFLWLCKLKTGGEWRWRWGENNK